MRKNPYTALLERAQEFAASVQYRHTKTMWTYPRGRLSQGWRLDTLAERVKAADQLGYDVILTTVDDALVVQYRKRVEIPFEFKR